MSRVRVRFAPSPTGHLHIGGLRTALFNWLFAKHHEGIFFLRVEDTDQERSQKNYIASQLDSLRWAGIVSNEPVLLQSNRMNEYRRIIEKLIDEQKAYRCFCNDKVINKKTGVEKYSGKCSTRNISKKDLHTPHVIRIKLPLYTNSLTFNDIIRGPITFSLEEFDDFIIARSDYTPVYNFVVVVDDAYMKISHVIRGEDHISNTPKQIFVYQALGYSIPKFAHLPLILGSDGERLSKREDATSVLEYRKNGYLPDALCNYLVRLGWSYGDQEIFNRKELISLFSLKKIGLSAAIFDKKKLDWMNSIYMRNTPTDILVDYIVYDVMPHIFERLKDWTKKTIFALVKLYKVRVSTLSELLQEIVSIHDESHNISQEDFKKWITPKIFLYLKDIMHYMNDLSHFSSENLKQLINNFAKKNGIQFVKIAQPIRLALIKKTSGPSIIELITALGREESIRRISKCIFEWQNNFEKR